MADPRRFVRSFLGASLAVLYAAMAAGPGKAQHAHSLVHWVAAATDEPCAAVWLTESIPRGAPIRLQQHLFDRPFNFEPLCAPLNFLNGISAGSSAVRQFPEVVVSRFAEDPVETELAAMGLDGMVIAGARRQVLEILREGNSCSGWFAEEEPNPAVKFASLHFQSDAAGSSFSRVGFDAGAFSSIQPYVARAQENVGSGSMITLNAHGAFFQQRALTQFRWPVSAPHSPPGVSMLRVGDYQGGSLKAQVATLLHEYAHIVGLIPVDAGRPDAAQLSTQNTETVLRHCRKQIDASPNRTILLPASFANF